MRTYLPGIADGAGSAPSILLVDDEVDILPEYQELLELEGLSSLATSDPLEAIQLVQERVELCLVITDLRMAKMDGASLIRELQRSMPAKRNLGFIILTGDASPASVAALPDVPILLKPIDLQRFVSTIKLALANVERRSLPTQAVSGLSAD